MINSEKMEVELGSLKISLTSIRGMICWSLFFNVSCNSFHSFKSVSKEMTEWWPTHENCRVHWCYSELDETFVGNKFYIISTIW